MITGEFLCGKLTGAVHTEVAVTGKQGGISQGVIGAWPAELLAATGDNAGDIKIRPLAA